MKMRSLCVAIALCTSSAFADEPASAPSSEAVSQPTLPQEPVPEPTPSTADPPRLPRLYVAYAPSLAARINPLGLFVGGPISVRFRLYDSDSPALKDNHVGLNIGVLLSPGLAKVGLGLELQPLTILSFNLSYDLYGFFGNFDYLQSYPSPTSESSDADMKALGSAKLNYPTYGGVLTFSTLFQIKLGPIALRSNLKLLRYDMRVRAGDTVFYDPLLDILSPAHGLTLTKDTDLLFVTKVGFAGGARYTLTTSFFSPSDYVPGEAQTNANVIHRIGPFLAYTFFDKQGAHRFNTPTLVLIAQWHIVHRWRVAPLPWIALAFLFKGII